eukprot:Gb_38183 [translate_table: standard]
MDLSIPCSSAKAAAIIVPNIAPAGLSSAKSRPSFVWVRPSERVINLRKRSSCPALATLSVAMEAPAGTSLANSVRLCTHIKPAPNKLKIGIVGFGNFGQFLAKAMLKQGHSVIATSRSDYADICEQMGIAFFRDPHDFCEEHPEVIVLCTSILSTESTLRALPLQRLKRNTLFVDVLSVKEFPRNLFLEVLPPECDILCTHPMFGPESGKGSWAGLPFVYDKVRVNHGGVLPHRCEEFLRIFEDEGCGMVEMSCAEHDRYAAGSQFITHTVGRILAQLNLESTPINTKGYETLLRLTENTMSDSFDLYYGLFMYNVNATEQMEKLDRAFEEVKQKLFGRLHDILRKQLVDRSLPSPNICKEAVAIKQVQATSYLPSPQYFTNLSSFLPPTVPFSPEKKKEAAVAEHNIAQEALHLTKIASPRGKSA